MTRTVYIATVVGLSVGASVGAYWVYAAPTASGPNGISVKQFGGCKEELPMGQPPQVVQVSSGGGALQVRVLANASCGPLAVEKPEAEIHGNTVSLNWGWHVEPDAPLAACLCTRTLDFRIPEAAGMKDPDVRAISEAQ